MNDTFTFKLGDLVTTKADLEVERRAFPLRKRILLIPPSQVVGRFFFESKTGIEEYYHIATRGEIRRHSIEELVPDTMLYRLWAELLGEVDAGKEEHP